MTRPMHKPDHPDDPVSRDDLGRLGADATPADIPAPQAARGDSFHLEVATLGRQLFSGRVRYVEVPGIAGHMGVLPGHTPVMTAVAPGTITLQPLQGEAQKIEVLGGIIEIGPWGVTVLADHAARGAEAEAQRMQAARARASAQPSRSERPVGAEAVRAELDAELARFFARVGRDMKR